MKLFSVLFLSAFCLTSSIVITPQIAFSFQEFQAKYNKQYASSEEWAKRMSIFAQSLERVKILNADPVYADGEGPFGVTQFSDLTPEEFESTYLTYRPSTTDNFERVEPEPIENLASSIDWSAKGAVTAIKNQGHCGSCWAFSVTAAVESYLFISGKYSLKHLSDQQVLSCTGTDDTCDGGHTSHGLDYVYYKGIELASDYPYVSGSSRVTEKCKYNSSKKLYHIKDWDQTSHSESALQSALQKGPPSVCIDGKALHDYSSGILKSCGTSISHCVQVVGYDTTNNYWKVRNSWGSSWGENGFFRLEMGKDLCLISKYVRYPIIG